MGGTLRRVSTTEWEILDDSGHTPVRLHSVEIVSTTFRGATAKCLKLTFAADGGSAAVAFDDVGWLVTQWDVLFAASGVRVGPSVGLGHALLFFFMGDSAVPVDPGALSVAYANVWVGGRMWVAGTTANRVR